MVFVYFLDTVEIDCRLDVGEDVPDVGVDSHCAGMGRPSLDLDCVRRENVWHCVHVILLPSPAVQFVLLELDHAGVRERSADLVDEVRDFFGIRSEV